MSEKVQNPCKKDCAERSVTCRKTCPKWKPYEEAKRAEWDENAKLAKAVMDAGEFRGKCIRRVMRKKRRRH